MLRWGYDTPDIWFYHLTRGVDIYRRDITAGEKSYSKIATVIPWDSTKIERTAAVLDGDKWLMVVLEHSYRHWENSAFNGFSNMFEMSDNFQNRWSLVHFAADMNPLAADAAGLRFTDKQVQTYHIYAYKLEGHGAQHPKAYHTVLPKKEEAPMIYDYYEKDSLVEIYWERIRYQNRYTAYYFESSKDNKNWIKINELPYVQGFDDHLREKATLFTFMFKTGNYEPTFIRMRGIDAFGDLSIPSASILVMGRDRTPPAPPVLSVDSLQSTQDIKFTWQTSGDADIDHFDLERSFAGEKIIHRIWAKKGQQSGSDRVPHGGVYKYRLAAVDTAGNVGYSEPYYVTARDDTPPSAPTGLSAKTDSSGVVTLTWDKAPEHDVIGYYIYYADGKERNFTRLNGTLHRYRIFQDTLSGRLLTMSRFYRVAAIDAQYLTGPFSEILEVIRPDVMAPSPAFISNYSILDHEFVQLKLQPSTSRDVVKHYLKRKSGTDEYETIKVFTKVPPLYMDTLRDDAQAYDYCLVAEDKGGLLSAVIDEVTVRRTRPKEEAVSLILSINDNGIEISCKERLEAGEYIQVYKRLSEDKMTQIGILKPDLKSLLDTRINSGMEYQYFGRKMNDTGNRSSFSSSQIVQVP